MQFSFFFLKIIYYAICVWIGKLLLFNDLFCWNKLKLLEIQGRLVKLFDITCRNATNRFKGII